jgi:hypothetical protein
MQIPPRGVCEDMTVGRVSFRLPRDIAFFPLLQIRGGERKVMRGQD